MQTSIGRLRLLNAAVLTLLLPLLADGQCPCRHGLCTANKTCKCDHGWAGNKCQRPCQDVYKACEYWQTEGRCVWTKRFTRFFLDNCPVTCKECTYDPTTVPPGLPLPPYLELLDPLIGEWYYESDSPIHFPVNFRKGGYTKTIKLMITEVPLFDTPSLNYSSTARSKLDPNDVHEDKGFLWVRPGKTEKRQTAFMLITNSGISMLQEGHLQGNTMRLATVHEASHPLSRCGQPYLREEHKLQWDGNWLIQSYKDDQGQLYQQTYIRVASRRTAH